MTRPHNAQFKYWHESRDHVPTLDRFTDTIIQSNRLCFANIFHQKKSFSKLGYKKLPPHI